MVPPQPLVLESPDNAFVVFIPLDNSKIKNISEYTI